MRAENTKPQLLYIGNEPLLSKASSILLKRVGYRVRVTNPFNARHVVSDASYAAVILCATLSCEEAEAVVTVVQIMQPNVPIVSVHLGLLGDAPHPSSSVVVDALQGPDALIGAVDSVVHGAHQRVS